MHTRIAAARAFLWQAAQAKARDGKAADLLVDQAKCVGAETGIWATEQCIRLSGGRGILKSQPLERWHRDSLSGPVMPPADERVLEIAGRVALGLPGAMVEWS
jgi:alkylation response protein AidB-like acyl-CoA dehydrogenase